jgi:FkbM family methyltransferase
MVLDFTDNASFKYASDRERYEPLETKAFLATICANPGCNVVDLGANYGAYTLAAGQLSKQGAAARVVAVEPDDRPFRALSRSIALNGLGPTVSVHQLIAGDRDGIENLWVNARSSADNRTHSVATSKIRVRETYQVQTTTVDNLLSSLHVPLSRPLVVKMDIQGNEPRAFYGMAEALATAACWVVLFEHAPYLIESAGIDLKEFLQWMFQCSFDSAYVSIRNDSFHKLDDKAALGEALVHLDPDPSYKGEARASNFLIARGTDLDPVLESLVAHR